MLKKKKKARDWMHFLTFQGFESPGGIDKLTGTEELKPEWMDSTSLGTLTNVSYIWTKYIIKNTLWKFCFLSWTITLFRANLFVLNRGEEKMNKLFLLPFCFSFSAHFSPSNISDPLIRKQEHWKSRIHPIYSCKVAWCLTLTAFSGFTPF